MKSHAILACSFLLCAVYAAASGEKAGMISVADKHPMAKVITLLDSLLVKVEAEGKFEEVTYLKFEYWCTGNIATLQKALQKEQDTIDFLSTKLQGELGEESTLTGELSSLLDTIQTEQQSEVQLTEKREDERALYETASSELKSTIHAIVQCEQSIEKLEQAKEVAKKGDEVLIQTQVKHEVRKFLSTVGSQLGNDQRRMLENFAQRPDLKVRGDRAAHVDQYTFKSQGVIEQLKDLQDKFEVKFFNLTASETDSAASYELLKAAKDDAIAAETAAKEKKAALLAGVQSQENQDTSDLNNNKNELSEDEKRKREKTAVCKAKKQEYKDRNNMRYVEMEAMKAAKKIIAKVGHVRTEAPENPILPSPIALLQIEDPKMKAVEFLRQKSRVLKSHALDRLATEIKAHLNGPFDDIDHAMQRMIWKLKEEQTEEDEHKKWCDKEESKTQIAKDEKDDKLDDATDKLDLAKARIQKCTIEMAESEKLIVAITKHFGEAETVRKAGHNENMEAIKDAEDAQKALSNAIAVLTDFYKDSGMVPKEAWEALLQTGAKELPGQPSTWDAEYTGTMDPQGQPNGIIHVLEAVSADFAEMLANTKAQEEEDQQAYLKDMSDSKIEQARRVEYIKVKEAEKKRTIDKLSDLQGDVKHKQKEVNAVVQYIEDLTHTCHGGDGTYEDRKAARAQEREALKEAEEIIRLAFHNDEEKKKVGFLQSSLRGTSRHD